MCIWNNWRHWGQPHPHTPLAHIKHGKNAHNQQGTTQIDHIFSGGTRHLKHTGLHLGKVLQLHGKRGRVQLQVPQRKHRLRHEGLGFFIRLHRFHPRLFAPQLGQFVQGTVQNAHQDFTGLGAFGFRNIGLNKVGHSLDAAHGFALDGLLPGKQRQCAGGRLRQLLCHLGPLGVHGIGSKLAHCLVAQRGVVQGVAQGRKTVQVAVFIGRNAQVFEGVRRGIPGAQQKHGRAVTGIKRQHVIVEFPRLAGRVAQFVGDAGTHIAQVLFGVWFVGRAQARIYGLVQGTAQVHLAHVRPRT